MGDLNESRKLLREALVRLINNPLRIEMIASDIGLKTGGVKFNEPVDLIWFQVIEEAAKVGLDDDLVARVLEDYPGDQQLAALRRAAPTPVGTPSTLAEATKRARELLRLIAKEQHWNVNLAFEVEIAVGTVGSYRGNRFIPLFSLVDRESELTVTRGGLDTVIDRGHGDDSFHAHMKAVERVEGRDALAELVRRFDGEWDPAWEVVEEVIVCDDVLLNVDGVRHTRISRDFPAIFQTVCFARARSTKPGASPKPVSGVHLASRARSPGCRRCEVVEFERDTPTPTGHVA